VSTVARFGGLRWTGEVAIPRQSFGRRTDALGHRRGARLAAGFGKIKSSGGVPEIGEGDRREEGAESSPIASESARRVRSAADVRREISPSRGRLHEREGKEMTEDIWGLL
jgi:hypothetical protein